MSTAPRLTAADAERLNTWLPEIAKALLPDVPMTQTATDFRFGNRGALAISRDGGGWFDHSAGKGGIWGVGLIQHLKSCSKVEAFDWASAFLGARSGVGSACDSSSDDAQGQLQRDRRAAYVNQVLAEAQPIEGTPAEAYLGSRGLIGNPPDILWYLPDARPGEGALVAHLRANGATVGIQLTYLDPQGRKSTVVPQRRVYFTDSPNAASGAFDLHLEADPEKPFIHQATIICEGVEDALSLALAHVGPRIVGFPGVSRITRYAPMTSEEILIVRDGDEPDSPAHKALMGAIDRLILAGAVVRVTDTPVGDDANSILQVQGPDALRNLGAAAVTKPPAELSIDGEVERLSRLAPLQYDQQRTVVAKHHNMRVATLDGLVADARNRREKAEEAAVGRARDDFDAPPWVGEIDVGQVLDRLCFEIDRYVRITPAERDAVALWVAHTHLVHNDRVRLVISPKLAIQAPSRGAGKSTLLELIGAVSFRSLTASSISAAAVFRMVDAGQNTLMLDEADQTLSDTKSELNAVLNSSHRRANGFVMRAERTPDGGFEPVRFSTYTGVAFAGINKLPPTLQDRSIVIQMRKATQAEAVQLAHLRDGTSPALDAIRSQLQTWGEALSELPDPEMPNELFNRRGDNWRPLIAIADLASGDWPERAQRAAVASVNDQSDDSFVALLAAIQRAFGARKKMTSDDLVNALIADSEEEYRTENRGRPITQKWLANHLTEVLEPRGPQKWRNGKKTERGYLQSQFVDVFVRYGLTGADGSVITSDEALKKAPHPPHPPQSNENSELPVAITVPATATPEATNRPTSIEEQPLAFATAAVADEAAAVALAEADAQSNCHTEEANNNSNLIHYVSGVAVVAAPGDVPLEDIGPDIEPSLLKDRALPSQQTPYGEPLL